MLDISKKTLLMHGWGRYPTEEATVFSVDSLSDINLVISNKISGIPFGNGRSYGDCALSKNILKIGSSKKLKSFDAINGLITCDSGMLLSDILEVIVPHGWFLPVVPGTKFITVGGAIAADVHGKNHHINGCFSEFVHSFNLVGAKGELYECSKSKNTSLFKATCGGMGLTGIIAEATLQLMKIPSSIIHQKKFKTNTLKETIEYFNTIKHESYSVAWIDASLPYEKMGRGIIQYGNFVLNESFSSLIKPQLTLPDFFPSGLFNRATVKAFNSLYLHLNTVNKNDTFVGWDDFFFPLDKISNWNVLYGPKGFMQIQYIFPEEVSYSALRALFRIMDRFNLVSSLAVLKLYGPQNENYLSFPMNGFSLAMDFPISAKLFQMVKSFENVLSEYGGRVYLAKDVCISSETFKKGYPNLDAFISVLEQYSCTDTFSSNQSQRLFI
jgi:decaprenylphospho-beta-D-ribofuranose 2-oxidase